MNGFAQGLYAALVCLLAAGVVQARPPQPRTLEMSTLCATGCNLSRAFLDRRVVERVAGLIGQWERENRGEYAALGSRFHVCNPQYCQSYKLIERGVIARGEVRLMRDGARQTRHGDETRTADAL